MDVLSPDPFRPCQLRWLARRIVLDEVSQALTADRVACFQVPGLSYDRGGSLITNRTDRPASLLLQPTGRRACSTNVYMLLARPAVRMRHPPLRARPNRDVRCFFMNLHAVLSLRNTASH